MIDSRLIAFTFAALLSSAALAATTSGTGPTDPVQAPNSPATQGLPKLNNDGTGTLNNGQPPATGTDPRVQGNDTGRQGGLNTPDSTAPDNAETGVGSKTTTGGSGSEGGAASQ